MREALVEVQAAGGHDGEVNIASGGGQHARAGSHIAPSVNSNISRCDHNTQSTPARQPQLMVVEPIRSRPNHYLGDNSATNFGVVSTIFFGWHTSCLFERESGRERQRERTKLNISQGVFCTYSNLFTFLKFNAFTFKSFATALDFFFIAWSKELIFYLKVFVYISIYVIDNCKGYITW